MEQPKTGIELIAQERKEQIEKHGYNTDSDQKYNNHEIAIVARELLDYHPSIHGLPASWRNSLVAHKMCSKSYKERLIIAGALIAAEIDRLQFNNSKNNTDGTANK